MYPEPVPGDANNPLVSILIYNYDGSCLRSCLEQIFSQDSLPNIEIILIDDATTDGSWEIAVEFSRKYNGFFTMTRNRIPLGPDLNARHCWSMVNGIYVLRLTEKQSFDPKYVRKCTMEMEVDRSVEPPTVQRHNPVPNGGPIAREKIPLASILIFNYNYGRYLRECLDSVFAQDYGNFEVCFSDNASTDESWDIALEYARRFPDKISIVRNRKNFGCDVNIMNCWLRSRGKYLVELCSDDAIEPSFVRKCVTALETNPDAGFAMVHRMIVDGDGKQIEEPPFYNQSCLIPGEEQAAVYMMAAVNPSVSQIMYNRQRADSKTAAGSLVARWYGSRILDFNICCQHPIVYIKEPLLLHRLHTRNDSSSAAVSQLEVIGPLVLIHQFIETAMQHNMQKVVGRLSQAIDKLSKLCLRYCVRFLCLNDERTALKYFHLSMSINPDTGEDPIFKQISGYWTSDAAGKASILESLKTTANLATRKVSYDPPQGSIPIEVKP